MLPVLLDLKIIKIYTSGVFLMLAFFWSSYLLWKLVHLTAYKEEDVFDSLFSSLFFSLFFGRLVYVLLNFSKFGFSVGKFILINGYPGFSVYGGLFGLFLGMKLFFRIKKIPFNEIVDYFIPPLFLSLAFTKIGNFFSGSEVGTPAKFFLSVRYVGADGFRHLTPFYEGLLFFLGVLITHRFLFAIRRGQYPKGFNGYLFCWYFAVVYLVFDKLKVYRLYLLGYSFNRSISLILLLTVSFYFLYYFRSLIYNFLYDNVKNTYQIIHRSAKKAPGRRPKKDAETDH